MSSTKSSSSGSKHKWTFSSLVDNKYAQGAAIVIAICAIVAIIVAVVMMMQSDDDKKLENGTSGDQDEHKPEEPACTRDSDCAESKVCHGKSGCCPKCSNSACTAGMLTAGGCIASEGSPQAYGSGHGSDQSNAHRADNVDAADKAMIPNPFMSVRGAWTNAWMSAFGDGSTDNKNTSGYSLGPDAMPYDVSGDRPENIGGSVAACRGHSDAFMKTCLGKDPMCCAVCVNGLSFQGVRGADGTCQTTVQQTGYTGMGQEPPNTYMVSSSGPKYGVAMGGCSVEPVGSSLSMYTGFYQQPQQ